MARGSLAETLEAQASGPAATSADVRGTSGQSGAFGLPHSGHARWVRLSHWIVAASVLTLAVSGYVILMAHPRLYWGATGNDLTPALFELPITRNYRHGGWENSFAFFAQSNSRVSASRTYDIFNQNSWGRSLHLLAGWFLALTGIVYLVAGIYTGHFRRHLIPRAGERTGQRVWEDLVSHLRFQFASTTGGPPYGVLQKWSYAAVVFFALPLMTVTGLAMSPAMTAAYPFLSGMFGGSQSARTIHFFVFAVLIVFAAAHILMVVLSGFRRQMRAMIIGS